MHMHKLSCNSKSKPCPLNFSVYSIFKPAKFIKESFSIFLRYTDTIVYNTYLNYISYGKNFYRYRRNLGAIFYCIINLIFNAIDAMPEGGTLTIENSLGSDKDVVEIKIKDTGYGISEENISNIFDPFFSTKAEGEGLGLGLSTVHGIIDRHGGTIGVESELGKGTVFTIKLPKFHD